MLIKCAYCANKYGSVPAAAMHLRYVPACHATHMFTTLQFSWFRVPS